MTTKYGMFKEHTYLRPGNSPFDKEAAASKGSADGEAAGSADKDRGLNFKVSVCKTGKTNDACFSKFISNNVGDKFIDPARRTLQAKNESNKAIVSSSPFRSASPMKKSPGLGDYYGTLSGKTEYVAVSARVAMHSGSKHARMRVVVAAALRHAGMRAQGGTHVCPRLACACRAARCMGRRRRRTSRWSRAASTPAPLRRAPLDTTRPRSASGKDTRAWLQSTSTSMSQVRMHGCMPPPFVR